MTLRVLHCIYDDPENPWVGGGGAVRVRALYRRLAGRVAATVATGRFPGARDGEVDGVRLLRLGAGEPYAWSRLTFAAAAGALLRRAAYDAAVFDFSAYTPIVLPRGRPVGITVHHLSGPTARARWGAAPAAAVARLERALLRQGDARRRVVSVDVAGTAAALADVLPAGAPVVVVPAGVDDALFDVARTPEEARTGAALLCLGRVDVFQKGLDTLLAAVARLCVTHPEVTLTVAGRGREGARVQALAAALGLGDRVRVLGPVDEPTRRALLAAAAVQVMPSRLEGFGMAAVEAMAAGVPLVASTAGALPEVTGAGPDGTGCGRRGAVLVPPDDPAALAEAVGGLLDDGAARARLVRDARVLAERYRWDAVAERHLAFLQRIAAGG